MTFWHQMNPISEVEPRMDTDGHGCGQTRKAQRKASRFDTGKNVGMALALSVFICVHPWLSNSHSGVQMNTDHRVAACEGERAAGYFAAGSMVTFTELLG